MILASRSLSPAGLLAAAAIVLGTPGCFGGAEHEVTPSRPIIQSFTASPSTVAPRGTSVLSWTVTGATSLSIAPGLGEVTGTSVSVRVTATTTYTLTATNAGGSSSTSVTVNVGAAPPAGLSYSQNPATYTAGVAIVPNVPSSTGGAITSYSVSPALPAGLVLNGATGAISGTPGAAAATAVYTVTGSNATGSTTVGLTLTVVAPDLPTIVSFTATPSSIAAGESSVLSWDVLGATLLEIDGGVGPVIGTSRTVTPASTTTYTLSATNAAGTVTATVTVTVLGPPTNLRYTTNPASYTVGVAITDNVPAFDGGTPTSFTGSLPPGLLLGATTGVVSGTPTTAAAATAYTITATNAAGSTTVDLTITVTPPVALPVISSFAANPPTVSPGGSSTLSWSVTGATSLAIDQGVGTVTGTSVVVTPTATTTYTLSATNAAGTATATVTVTVLGPPTNLRYTTNPASYTVGVAIADNVPAFDGGTPTSYVGDLPAGLVLDPATGVISGTPTAATPLASYTITASNDAGGAIADLAISVTEGVLPPTNLAYSQNPAVYAVDAPISPNQPSSSGGAITGYTVTPDLPAGLSLDPVTGVLSGTPLATTSQATYTVTGSNPAGSTTVGLVLTVNDPGLAIVVQPANQSALPGRTSTFSVVASGLGLHYQWRNGSTNVGTDQSSYTTPVLTPADAGSIFSVVVTDGVGGSVTSANAVLTLRGFFPIVNRMTDSLYGHTATLLDDGRVLIAGGNRGGAGSTNLAEVYDPSTRSFTRTSNTMSVPRQGHSAVKLRDGRVLVIGGCQAGALLCTQFWTSFDVFDPATNRFQDPAPTARMTTARAYFAAALLPSPDDRVLLAGGYVTRTTITDTADVLDPGAGPGLETILSTAPMTTPRAFPASAALPGDGTVLVAGGQAVVQNVTVPLASAEKFRLAVSDAPSLGTFAATGNLAGGRTNGVATPPEAGSTLPVLLDGGSASGMPISNPASPVPGLITAERFDGAAFTSTGALNAARNWQTATRLPSSGEVLVAGGTSSEAYLSSAEIYDPVTGVFTLAPSMGSPRAQHTATVLLDGTVLVAGGRTGAVGSVGTTLNSAEVWAPYPGP